MSEGKTPQRDRLDALLAEWPATPRSPAEWDESAADVVAKLGAEPASRASVSDEALLGAPLPASDDEMAGSVPTSTRQVVAEGAMNTTSSRERDRTHLKDLAKLADMAPTSSRMPSVRPTPAAEPVEERKEDSGLINLAALATAEAPVATAVAAAAEAVAPTAAAKAAQPAVSAKKGGTAWMLYGGVVAAAAVAAGIFFNLRGSNAPSSSVGSGPVAVQASPPVAAPTEPMPTPIAPSDRGIDPSALPQADLGAGHGAGTPSTHASTGAAPVVAAAPTAVAQAAPEPPAPPAAATATGSSASLEALMQQAAGVSSNPGAPTATAADTPAPAAAPGSVPLKPSQGAVTGALGAVLPAARACLDPDDPVSRVTVTFQSDGSVQGVSVSGGAAGKPAEACIRSAIMKARVQPFALPTFSFGTTVRPN